MAHIKRPGLVISVSLVIVLLLVVMPGQTVRAGPQLFDITVLTAGAIPRYGLYEIAFRLDSVATNPYLPYDSAPPPGVPAGTGVSVEMLILPPGQADWQQALVLPCFWYQPVDEMGAGDDVALVPSGAAQWRARYTPEMVGRYVYRLQATDANGVTLSESRTFDAVSSDLGGFVRVGQQDVRFFELSDGTPLLSPLINMEQGQPFDTLAAARSNIPQLAANGLRFVRWFPTGEGANYHVVPFGDDIKSSWGFGGAAGVTSSQPDLAQSRRFSFRPYYYSGQSLPAVPGSRYRLTLRAQIEGDQVLRVRLGDAASVDIGAVGSVYHERLGQHCDYRLSGWQSYALEGVVEHDHLSVMLHGLYVSSDAPVPYNVALSGAIRVHSIVLQRDETGAGGWGPNLIVRGDPDTYNTIDQRCAALLDEVLRLSAEQGVYHKLPLFHKNDRVLNHFEPDGSIASDGDWDAMNERFYAQPGMAARWYEMAYARYFIARWSYSTALHSLELANENHLTPASYAAGWDLAAYVRNTSPRRILMSNSFWGWFVGSFFQDSTYGHLIDYADQHWYASEEQTNAPLISNTWHDSAAYVREAWTSFVQVGYGSGPIVRGEGGVTRLGTYPQHPDIASEPQGVYYHKKVWAHVGSLGWSMDGEWYPRLTSAENVGKFPNPQRDVWDVYAAYDRFVRDEPINNGRYRAIGDDLWGDRQVMVTADQGQLRAWGVRDATNASALLWIDNAQHTWARVAAGQSVAPASGSVVVQGLPAGNYRVTRWDTVAGRETGSTTHSVAVDGRLTLSISALTQDVACKINRESGFVAEPMKQPLALEQGWNLISLAGQPTSAAIVDILAPVASWCDVAWAFDASDGAPWRSYTPSAPLYANRLQTLDISQGLWLHMREPATLLIRGMTSDANIPLLEGWNLVGYPRLNAQPIAEATASISQEVTRIYAYQTQLEGGDWQIWDVELPPEARGLDQLEPGRGYWIEVSSACIWQIP